MGSSTSPRKFSQPSDPPTPFFVFVSSDQDEFSELRNEVREAIDSEYLYNEKRTTQKEELVQQGNITKAVLVERGSKESFDVAMKEGLDQSQIYVGIFGNRYSAITVKEYLTARSQGLPLLIYYFAEPPRTASGLRTKTVQFLNKEVKPHVIIRGNYNKVMFRRREDLIDQILVDISRTMVDLVRESVSVRRLLLQEAPDALLGAILRSKQTVF